jgi:localization factor PodJL
MFGALPSDAAQHLDAETWLDMFGAAETAPEALLADAPDIAALPLIHLVEPAPANDHMPAPAYALPATRPQADAPPRRRSTGLIRSAAALIAAVAFAGWYVEQRRETAQAAEPQAAAPIPAPAAESDPVRQLAQYQRALRNLETGNREEGAALLRQLADTGFAMAQYRLAKIYERGQAGRADLALARQWTERAANAGNVQAMHDLGVYNSRDETAPRDEVAAFRWFRQAADFDLRDSQFNLGVIYQQGRGVTADHAEALFWFLLAARHDDADAAARAAALEAELTPMQIEQARARAQAFRPRTSEPVANGMFDAPAAVAAAPGAPSPAEPAVQPAQTAAH